MRLPSGLGRALRAAVGELGMLGASRLFLEETAEAGGAPLVALLRDELGRDWPVLDALAAGWLDGVRLPPPDPRALLQAIGPASRIVCVGVEAAHLDALVAATSTPIFLVQQSVFQPDWDRISANYGGRLHLETLDGFQRLAGPRSVLLTFSYGRAGDQTHVLPAWIRVSGADVRAQFRSLLAWEVLPLPFFVYPRWLTPTPTDSFTAVVQA